MSTLYHEAGKGDAPRPMAVKLAEFHRRWDLVFAKHRPAGRCPRCNSGASMNVGWTRECLACGYKFKM